MGAALTAVGYVIELIGFGCTARGLYLTWEERANGRPFLPPRLNEPWQRFRGRIGRPRNITLQVDDVVVLTTAESVVLKSERAITDQMTVEERVEALAHNVDQVSKRLDTALDRMAVEASATEGHVTRLHGELSNVRTAMTDQDNELAVSGVPMAVVGLVMALIGLLMQGIGSFL